jgi:hypothetical protein
MVMGTLLKPVPAFCPGWCLSWLCSYSSTGQIIQFSMSPGMMQLPTARGQGSGCPRKLSGSTAVEEVCKIGTWKVSSCWTICWPFFQLWNLLWLGSWLETILVQTGFFLPCEVLRWHWWMSHQFFTAPKAKWALVVLERVPAMQAPLCNILLLRATWQTALLLAFSYFRHLLKQWYFSASRAMRQKTHV